MKTFLAVILFSFSSKLSFAQADSSTIINSKKTTLNSLQLWHNGLNKGDLYFNGMYGLYTIEAIYGINRIMSFGITSMPGITLLSRNFNFPLLGNLNFHIPIEDNGGLGIKLYYGKHYFDYDWKKDRIAICLIGGNYLGKKVQFNISTGLFVFSKIIDDYTRYILNDPKKGGVYYQVNYYEKRVTDGSLIFNASASFKLKRKTIYQIETVLIFPNDDVNFMLNNSLQWRYKNRFSVNYGFWMLFGGDVALAPIPFISLTKTFSLLKKN